MGSGKDNSKEDHSDAKTNPETQTDCQLDEKKMIELVVMIPGKLIVFLTVL